MVLDSHSLNECHCSWAENLMKRMRMSHSDQPITQSENLYACKYTFIWKKAESLYVEVGIFFWNPHFHLCLFFHFLGNHQKGSRAILYSSITLLHASHRVNSYLSADTEYWCLGSVAFNWTCNLFWILSVGPLPPRALWNSLMYSKLDSNSRMALSFCIFMLPAPVLGLQIFLNRFLKSKLFVPALSTYDKHQ